MSTSRRSLKSSQSLYGTSTHPTMLPIDYSHGHEWLTHIPFVPCQSAPLNPSHSSNKTISNFDLETTRWRSWVWPKGKTIVSPVSNWFVLFLFHINQVIIPEIQLFWNLTMKKSKVKVKGEVKGQGRIVHPTSNPCTSFSFHINRTNQSWDMSNRVFDLE